MTDIENDDRVFDVVDLVQHSPVSREARAEDALKLLSQGLAHAVRVREQWAGNELDRCRGDVGRQSIRDGPARRRRCSKLVGLGHNVR